MPSKLILLIIFLSLNSCESKNLQKKDSKPKWISSVESEYPNAFYLSSMGVSDSKNNAEKEALQGIASIFKVKIEANETFEKLVKETDLNGKSAIEKTANVIKQISVSTNQNLINTKIEKYYFDEKNNKHYALAVMDKAMTAEILRSNFSSNNSIMKEWHNSLPELSDPDKLKALNRLQKLLTANELLSDMISILEPAPFNEKSSYSRIYLTKLRHEISQQIPVLINFKSIPNAVESKVKQILVNYGFAISENVESSKIVVSGDFKQEKQEFDDSPNKFIFWNISIEFKYNDQIIGSYSDNGRSGQLSFNAALKKAESAMTENLDSKLTVYIETELFN